MPGEWYDGLNKPEWNPPNWIFGPVWTVLYLLIAIAGWLVWRAKGFGLALFFWFAQLAFNGAWSYLMFGEHQIDSAMIDLTLMWLAIVAFMVTAWRLSRLAVLLFVPYLFWVSFAGALNYTLLQLNP